jgi:hypothetical protein
VEVVVIVEELELELDVVVKLVVEALQVPKLLAIVRI